MVQGDSRGYRRQRIPQLQPTHPVHDALPMQAGQRVERWRDHDAHGGRLANHSRVAPFEVILARAAGAGVGSCRGDQHADAATETPTQPCALPSSSFTWLRLFQ